MAYSFVSALIVFVLFSLQRLNNFKKAVNYRLKQEDIAYIFTHGEVEAIIADEEYLKLLDAFRLQNPTIPIIVDTDVDAVEGELSGPFDDAVLEGLTHDTMAGGRGWDGLEVHPADENSLFALPYTSGTTSRPKGVECTYRGCYLAALANVIESGLSFQSKRCRYLWTLPMFHVLGEYISMHVCVHTHQLTILYRLDIPMGSHRCPGNSLLSAKDRQPPDLEISEASTCHALQRSADSQQYALQ